jgi:proline dehydrogenase
MELPEVMKNERNRWALPDLDSAVNWCKERNNQGIRCTIDILGENKKTEEDAQHIAEEYKNCLNSIRKENLKASLTVKLSALGANIDSTLCENNLHDILKEAQENQVMVEIDIEGAPLVDFTIDAAIRIAKEGFPIILALQVYLERTPEDLKRVLSHGINVRLVKGAYKGDTDDFFLIQNNFRGLFELLLDSDSDFLVGTHDPELIEWIKDRTQEKKEEIEFGFLKGFADKTKLFMVEQGWRVSEYIPFGSEQRAYETRRKRYLLELEKLGRIPIP